MAVDIVAAGRQAIERNDWDTAYSLLREASEQGALDAEGLERLARSAWWSGRPDECDDALERAFAGYIDASQPERAARIALDIAESHFHKKAAAVGEAWISRAARLLEELPDSIHHGYLARTQAVIAFEAKGDLETALELAQRAYDLGTGFGDRDLQAIALHDRGRIMVAAGDVEQGMALMDEAMVAAVGGELGALYTGKIYCNMIDICEQLADYRRAGDWSDAAKRWCDRAGHSSGFPGVCRVHRAEIMRLRGEWAAAEEEATRASRELGNFVDFAGEAIYEIGEIRLHMGDFDGAAEAFQQAHGMGRSPEPGMAELRLARGDADGAWALISEGLAGRVAPLQRARLLPTAVEAAVRRGDRDGARRATDELVAIASEYGTPALVAHAEGAEGLVALHDGSATDAVVHLRRAVDLWRACDLPYLGARSRVTLAAALSAQGGAQSAHLEMSAALKTFRELGAMADARAAHQSLMELGGGSTEAGRTAQTLMFTDIVDSTALIRAIGDDAWERLLVWHHRTLRAIVAGAGGREVENTGDGLFVAFDHPQVAVDCAIDIQQALERQRTEHGFAPAVRIGIHAGPVTEVGATLAGEEVHLAARIGAAAGPSQIVVSSAVAAAIADVSLGEAELVSLKGFDDDVEIVPIDWR